MLTWAQAKAMVDSAEEVRTAAIEEAENPVELLGDVGRWAALNGYDAINVPKHNSMVILNRSILTVEKAGA